VQQKTFLLQEITADRGKAFLSDLGIGKVFPLTYPNGLIVTASPRELREAGIILDLVDANDQFVIEALAPASMARVLPSNDQIAQAIGAITIGTFASPPEQGQGARAIIDLHGDTVLAIVPARLWPDIRAIVQSGTEAAAYQKGTGHQVAQPDNRPVQTAANERATNIGSWQNEVSASGVLGERRSPSPDPAEHLAQLTRMGEPGVKSDRPEGPQPVPAVGGETPSLQNSRTSGRDLSGPSEPVALRSQPDPEVSRGVLKPSRRVGKPRAASDACPVVPLDNGDDVLELSLPQTIELIQLLDLVGAYLHLDCIYDPEKIGKQVVTLKLHSKLQSELRVKDLYSLLETVLKFKGLVMTRHEGNLVSIVPAAEALEADPALVDPNTRTLQAGDMVVTRVFELQHVDVASITNLLQNMKLSVAVSPIEETQTLFVTCYAHRMSRVEQLVSMVDRPGRPREFRFRQLRYTMAGMLSEKIVALAEELEGIPITVGAVEGKASTTAPRSSRGTRGTSESQDAISRTAQAVYLDTDQRTNRILMIGYDQQLTTVEELVDALDVPQQDPRTLKVYDIKYVDAREVMQKLQELDILGKTTQTSARISRTAGGPGAGTTAGAPDEEPQIVLLEVTNSLLVNATHEQHAQIQMIIGYVDVSLPDLRTLKVYDIKHVDAYEVVKKLEEMEVIGKGAWSAGRVSRTSSSHTSPPSGAVTTNATAQALTENPQVAVLEVTNSLLVNATEGQHGRIQAIIQYLDVEARQDAIPYELYSLENQDPDRLAEVLCKLIQETIKNKEGKIEEVIRKTDEQITIVPDKGTFSLIVQASRKNQEWISKLVKQLDKRRPQVLIDATLVEVTKIDAFSYDLNLIESFPDLTATSGLTGVIAKGVTSTDILGRLAASGRDQFIDLQSRSGDFTGFYGDEHVHILLEAMHAKNYGRVLAMPKILANDNETGTIKTADTTYVQKSSSIPVSSGGAGTDATLIQTAVEFESYEAGITLNITPHISEGELLRLDIELTRSDFRETEDREKPPDTTASEVKTTVTVPDGKTIILGGMLKLNQNKGGTKVPILGDIPLVGGLFRSVNNKDLQSKLYVFVKAEIIRPAGTVAKGMQDLEAISERNRLAFEKYEQEFQSHQDWPGIKPKPVDPVKVLEAR
jgi:type II secretory pathway component GspD/PulD (secretin)